MSIVLCCELKEQSRWTKDDGGQRIDGRLDSAWELVVARWSKLRLELCVCTSKDSITSYGAINSDYFNFWGACDSCAADGVYKEAPP